MAEATHFIHIMYAETQPQRYARLKDATRRRRDGKPDRRFSDGQFVDRFEREGPVGIFA